MAAMMDLHDDYDVLSRPESIMGLALSALPFPIIVVSGDDVVSTNETFKRSFGWSSTHGDVTLKELLRISGMGLSSLPDEVRKTADKGRRTLIPRACLSLEDSTKTYNIYLLPFGPRPHFVTVLLEDITIMVNLERNLVRSNEISSSILKSVDAAMFLFDLSDETFTPTWKNTMFERRYGKDMPEEVMGFISASLDPAMKGDSNPWAEFSIGDEHFKVTLLPVRDMSGEVTSALVSMVDITDIMDLKGQVAKEKSFLESVLGSLRMPLIVQDEGNNYDTVLANQAYTEHDHESFRSWLEYQTFSDDGLEPIQTKETPETVEVDTGRFYFVSSSPMAVEDSTYRITIGEDVSQQALMELEVERSRSFLEDVIRSVGEGIVVMDLDLGIVQSNATAESMFALHGSHTRRKDGTRSLLDHFPVERKLLTRVGKNTLIDLVDENGSKHVYSWRIEALRDSSGDMDGYVGSFRDVTEEEALKGELMQRQLVMEILVAVRNAFLNPLPTLLMSVPAAARDTYIRDIIVGFEEIFWSMSLLKKEPNYVLRSLINGLGHLGGEFSMEDEGKDQYKLKATLCPWSDSPRKNRVFCLVCKAFFTRFTTRAMRDRGKQVFFKIDKSIAYGADHCEFTLKIY